MDYQVGATYLMKTAAVLLEGFPSTLTCLEGTFQPLKLYFLEAIGIAWGEKKAWHIALAPEGRNQCSENGPGKKAPSHWLLIREEETSRITKRMVGKYSWADFLFSGITFEFIAFLNFFKVFFQLLMWVEHIGRKPI